MMPHTFTRSTNSDYGCTDCSGEQEWKGMQIAQQHWHAGPGLQQLTLRSTIKHAPLTGNIAAPAVPTTGIVDIVALREQPTRHGITRIALGESFVREQIDLCICVVVARSWTCIHTSTISMLQSWLPCTCSWAAGDAPNIPIITGHTDPCALKYCDAAVGAMHSKTAGNSCIDFKLISIFYVTGSQLGRFCSSRATKVH
jgi:hypothetical protein